ncbi:hypothetical protein [Spirosoma utsteinense]|uniref:hypothetical protein n=1 Tax=Spirosoma utsteinense TaxID=2585773 RepID=UPI0016487BA6|nr:hypothetical protein [Spirosoma utsteinense]MBC3787800.1 DNA-binding LytR/AlgR family response regulator [Spirosoma utsteinense]
MIRTNWPQQLHRIAYLSAEGNYTFIHFTDAPDWLVSVNLTTLLDEFAGFIRIHRK